MQLGGSERSWDGLGIVIGGVACATIARQVVHEIGIAGPSSVSLVFTVGFLVVYGFWFSYGLRFGRIGIWLPNAIATALQLLFTAVVFSKLE